MMSQRGRRWPNIALTLARRFTAGIYIFTCYPQAAPEYIPRCSISPLPSQKAVSGEQRCWNLAISCQYPAIKSCRLCRTKVVPP